MPLPSGVSGRVFCSRPWLGLIGLGLVDPLRRRTDFRAGMGAETLVTRFAATGVGLGLARCNRCVATQSDWCLGAAGTHRSGAGRTFLCLGPVSWRWPIPLAGGKSVTLSAGRAGRHAAWSAGRLLNLPVDAGQTAAYPNLGITPPPPNYLLEPATFSSRAEY